MSLEVEGKLHKKFPTESKSTTFQAREFVIEIKSGNYSEYVKFQLVQDKCSLIDDYQEGDLIKVYFDLRGREWQGKYFTNLNAWRLAKGQGTESPNTGNPPAAGKSSSGDFPSAADEPGFGGSDNDDLPF